MTKEPTITINGRLLTNAQAMTVRCAIECFWSELDDNGLGDDENSKTMTRLYKERIDEIRERIFTEADNPTVLFSATGPSGVWNPRGDA